MVDGIAHDEVRKLYDEREVIWKPDDRWHFAVHLAINSWIRRCVADHVWAARGNAVVLNAGAGDNQYGLSGPVVVNLDVSIKGISRLGRPVNATVTELPFPDGAFDCVICAGSVVNYAGLGKTVSEAARVLRPGGVFLFDCELSSSWEYLRSDAYRAAARAVVTSYDGQGERIWVYSIPYLTDLTRSAGFNTLDVSGMHYVSSAVLGLTGNSDFSARFRFLDSAFSKLFPISCAGLALFAMEKRPESA